MLGQPVNSMCWHAVALRSQGSIKKKHEETILSKLLTLQPEGAAIKSNGWTFCAVVNVRECVWKRQRDRGEMRLDHRDLLHGRGILISIKTGPAHSSRELKTLIVLSAFLSLSHCWLYFIPLAFVCSRSPRSLLAAYEVASVHAV